MTPATANIAQAGKFLSFRIGQDHFGVEILRIQEIVAGRNLVHAPDTPDSVRGLMDLRGCYVPVVDMRRCLNLPPHRETERNSIIVTEIPAAGRTLPVGLLVDEVCEVLNFSDEDIHTPPVGGGGMEELDFINGLGRSADRDVILVDVQHLLDNGELSALEDLVD